MTWAICYELSLLNGFVQKLCDVLKQGFKIVLFSNVSGTLIKHAVETFRFETETRSTPRGCLHPCAHVWQGASASEALKISKHETSLCLIEICKQCKMWCNTIETCLFVFWNHFGLVWPFLGSGGVWKWSWAIWLRPVLIWAHIEPYAPISVQIPWFLNK